MNKPLFLAMTALGIFAAASVSFSAANAKTVLTDVPRAEWAKYGINPWKLDTDNDGFTDKDEIASAYCPTSADSISITDKNCKRGRFNLTTGVYTQPLGANFLAARDIKKFRSCSELTAAMIAAQKQYMSGSGGSVNYGMGVPISAPVMADSFGISQPSAAGLAAKSAEYSTTNIQVEGVDEGDIIKTDGQRIYYLANNNLIIASADPSAKEVLSTTPLNAALDASEVYLSGSHVVVVGRTYSAIEPLVKPMVGSAAMIRAPYPYYGAGRTVATIIDVSRPSDPVIVRSVEITGNLVASRLTNDYVYLVMNASVPWYGVTAVKPADLMPQVRDITSEKSVAELVAGESSQVLKPLTSCTDVEYLSPRPGDGFLEIVAIPVNNPKAPLGKKVIWGVASGSQVYASPSNIYVAAPNYQYRFGRSLTERTELYKFSFAKNTIKFAASQTVPGTVLNQFSMDEHNGLFRLATTERARGGGTADFTNHLFILNDDLSRLSSIDKFAPTEKIYSARFMGDRAYVVTFRTIDPFIVFDLKDPRSPQYIGELKIPGFSDYLHPYDATHVVGIGKNTGNDGETGFVWTEGLKLGMFDVTNPNIPTQMFSTVIGDRGSDSEALRDHHAFLFSKEKNLLAFPATVMTLSDEQKNATSTRGWEYGRESFRGLLVYNVDLWNGFKELGRITHRPSSTPTDEYGYYRGYGNDTIKRSLYIGDKLYAASDSQLTIHSLWNLMPLGGVKF